MKAHRNLFFIYLLALLTTALLIDAFTEGLMSLFYTGIAAILFAVLGLVYVKGMRKVGFYVAGLRSTGQFLIRGYRRGIPPASRFQATTSVVSGLALGQQGLVLLH